MRPLKCTRSEVCSALCPRLPTGKRTRSSAPAQRCIHAHQLKAHPLKRNRGALYPRPPTGKHTRSSAPLRTVSTPTNWQLHPLKCALSEVYPHQQLVTHPLKRTLHARQLASRSALYPRLPAGAQAQPLSTVSTPHQLVAPPLKCTRSALPSNWKHARSSAPAQRCIPKQTRSELTRQLISTPTSSAGALAHHANELVSTPTHVRPLPRPPTGKHPPKCPLSTPSTTFPHPAQVNPLSTVSTPTHW